MHCQYKANSLDCSRTKETNLGGRTLQNFSGKNFSFKSGFPQRIFTATSVSKQDFLGKGLRFKPGYLGKDPYFKMRIS